MTAAYVTRRPHLLLNQVFFAEEKKEREVNQTSSDDSISKDEYITTLKAQVQDLQKRLDSKEDEVSELHATKTGWW